MILNGVAASAILNTDPGLVGKMIGAGALGASVSGNGPAFAAIARKNDLARVKRQFPKLQGRIITVPVNCKKAHASSYAPVMLTPAFMDASTPARITFASSIFFENNLAHASATAVDMALELFRPYPAGICVFNDTVIL